MEPPGPRSASPRLRAAAGGAAAAPPRPALRGLLTPDGEQRWPGGPGRRGGSRSSSPTPGRPKAAAVIGGLALVLALGVVAPGAPAGAAGPVQNPPPTDPVAVAQALNGAWNAGHVEQVVALFAADAVIQQVGAELTPYQGTTAVTAADVYGTTRFFPDARLPEREGAVVWAAGTAEIRTWVSDLVARRHVVEATGYRPDGPDGARARWAYRVFVAPYRDFRDVPPTEGTAELRLRDGQIAALTLASSAESVRRRERALLDVAAARFAGRRTAAPRAGGAPAVGPWVVATGLSLGGVVLVALLRPQPRAPARAAAGARAPGLVAGTTQGIGGRDGPGGEPRGRARAGREAPGPGGRPRPAAGAAAAAAAAAWAVPRGGAPAPGSARAWGAAAAGRPPPVLAGAGEAAEPAAGSSTPEPALVASARAFTAAWNAQNLPVVVARFAPDAVVRERHGAVPAAVWDARDPQVVRAYLAGAHDGDSYDANGFVWATGHPQITAWVAARFARNHRIVPDSLRVTGDTVTWGYQELIDPAQVALGIAPLEGDAEAVVRGGRITVLSLVVAPEAVQRLRREAMAAVVGAAAQRRASPSGDAPGGPARPPRGAAEPPGATWPVALGSLALVGVFTVALRRRRLH